MSADRWFGEAENAIRRAEWMYQHADTRGAYTQFGFAAEFAIKAIYLKHRQLQEMPQTCRGAAWHDLAFVAQQAGLSDEIASFTRKRRVNWAVVRDWDRSRQYPNLALAKREVRDLRQALMNDSNGIWAWLRSIYQSD